MRWTNGMSVQRFKVKRRGELNLRPTGEYFYKHCLCLPKDVTNSMRLANGQTMYIEHDGRQCVMRTERTSQDDYEVRINEIVTKRVNGRTYTVTRFIIPTRLVSLLKIDKGDTVKVFESRDGITMQF